MIEVNALRLLAYYLYLHLLLITNPPRLFRLLMQQDWYLGLLDSWIDRVGVGRADTLLDAGCGPGVLTHRLADRCALCVGADSSLRMLRAAKVTAQSPSVALLCTDLGSSALATASFDLVVASSLLNALKEPAPVLAELLRLARPGGIVSLLFPTPAMTRKNVVQHARKANLAPFGYALLRMWQQWAPKKAPEQFEQLIMTFNVMNVERDDHLDGMVASLSFRNPII